MPLPAGVTAAATEATIKIPFESAERAEIVYRVLSVDQEPRRNFVQKDLRVDGNVLEAHFTADQAKNLRTAITSYFEALFLCTDTIKAFETPPPASCGNAGTHTGADTA